MAMTERHQIGIFAAMETADFYPHAVSTIEQRDTHISKVFLTGDYAYKIKKPVNLEFLDFTSLDKRRHFCQQEINLNRRLASDVYLEVVPITFQDGRYRMSGGGRPVEYAVRMRQLPEAYTMLKLVRRGKLGNTLIDKLAGVLADFYGHATVSESIESVGSLESVRLNCEENFRQTEKFLSIFIDERMFSIIKSATNAFLNRRQALFKRRVQQEKIRDCHGDLRTGHIYFSNGIKIIDCIEFNDRFRYSDVASDLAFLAMDLDFEGYPQIAQRLINTYLETTGDEEMLILLDFYKCYRAYVRFKVNCFYLQGEDLPLSARSKLIKETHRYLTLAYRYAVQFTRPTIWVVCGLPGGGKSTIAMEMANRLGVKILQSDYVRKQLLGAPKERPESIPFESGIYSKEASSLTYGKLMMLTQEIVEKGGSVILDATFSLQRQRNEVMRLARDMDANILFIECGASYEILKRRLANRENTAGISDARLSHLKHHKAHFDPINELQSDMHLKIDTEESLDECMRRLFSHDYIFLTQQTDRALKRMI